MSWYAAKVLQDFYVSIIAVVRTTLLTGESLAVATYYALTPFKVIQGHRCRYQSKDRMRLPISRWPAGGVQRGERPVRIVFLPSQSRLLVTGGVDLVLRRRLDHIMVHNGQQATVLGTYSSKWRTTDRTVISWDRLIVLQLAYTADWSTHRQCNLPVQSAKPETRSKHNLWHFDKIICTLVTLSVKSDRKKPSCSSVKCIKSRKTN